MSSRCEDVLIILHSSHISLMLGPYPTFHNSSLKQALTKRAFRAQTISLLYVSIHFLEDTMIQTSANRMTTNPNRAFATCSTLSVRPEVLDKQTMAETSGGSSITTGILIGIVIGKVVSKGASYVVDLYEDVVSEICADMYGDTFSPSNGCDC